MDEDVQRYVDEIPADHRPLFDRVHGLILAAHPEAEVRLSYKMPTYQVGPRRLYVGAWAHGVSFYGWQAGHDGGFTARHPELTSGRGTIRLRPEDAADIPDEELTTLIRAALDDEE
jgi:uncharacterized protein YdhG (YjbR/CyaY superfamily)